MLLCFGALPASAQIQWRLSVKFILDANGNRPATGIVTRDADVNAQINAANQVLANTGRGFRFALEILEVSGASQWFSVDSRSTANKVALETAAIADPARYQFRNNAINIYINGDTNSGVCSFPGGGSIILVGQGSRNTTLFHESGHFFNLCHTQGCECGGCGEAPNPPTCATVPGNDGAADTLPDLACWEQDNIANNTFGINYENLNAGQQAQVDAVFFNIMSYHGTRDRLTDDQMDRLTDAASSDRRNVATGRTWFVDRNCGSIIRNGSSRCDAFSGPFGLVRDGLNSASSGDIVLIRAGNYNERQTFNRPATLRASRGAVVIGRP
jgi:hypothetical protein